MINVALKIFLSLEDTIFKIKRTRPQTGTIFKACQALLYRKQKNYYKLIKGNPKQAIHKKKKTNGH